MIFVSDLKLFNEFLNREEEERNRENIPATELQQLAKKFVLGVRKKNGEEYEPSSLRGFLQSVDCYLRKKGCTCSLLNDKGFCEVQDILKKKQKQLKAIGKGNKPNRVFSHDVTAAILVSQNNETAAMLVSQTNPLGVVLFSYANAFFCSNKFA